MRAKLEDHGKPVIYLGSMPDHAKDMYRFLNVATQKVINSCNVIWLSKSYGDFMNLGPDQVSYIQAKLMERVAPLRVFLLVSLLVSALCPLLCL
jgi:hypothetical protein